MASTQSDARPAVIFDLGGVLIDWNPRYLYRRFFPEDPQAIERFLSEVDFFKWNVIQDAGRPFAEAIAEQCALFPAHADLIRAYDTYYGESISGPIAPTVAVLSGLRAAGYPLYALSNWPQEKFLAVRPRFPFFDWFDQVFISGELGVVKPDPRIFAIVLKRTGRRAEECIFIDDSPANIAAARELGFQAVRFQDAEQLKAELARLGVCVE